MCEHQFCRDCWREYLTIKIMDEGVGQVELCYCCIVVIICASFTNDVHGFHTRLLLEVSRLVIGQIVHISLAKA